MSVTPYSRYQQDLSSSGFLADDAQLTAITHLQDLYEQLIASHQSNLWLECQHSAPRRAFSRVTRILGIRRSLIEVRGVYFWGGVGRGKTYLMDLFYESLPFKQKMRTHFHRFMRRVHQELASLNEQPDPLDVVAERLACEARVICFDEFFVVDITDAMILATLLKNLFERGVVLVATSNIAPAGLYENGLQRVRFLPAIGLLEHFTHVVNVDGGVDYRLRTLEQAALYYLSGDGTVPKLERCFFRLIPGQAKVQEGGNLEIEGRPIAVVRVADDIVWFDFDAVCNGPRSQNDYIELAREYHAVIVENIPFLGGQNDDQARRFIYLVDEFYDRGVKLIISAAAPIHKLYQEGRLAFEFQRTISRVQEMQSQEYLSRPHKA